MSTTDLFEMTTRCSRGRSGGSASERSRNNSNVPTPSTMSRAVSIEQDLANLQDPSISQTQKLKNYFTKLENDFADEESKAGDDDDNDDDDEDDDEEEEETAVDDPNDLLSSQNLRLSYSYYLDQTPQQHSSSHQLPPLHTHVHQPAPFFLKNLKNNWNLNFQSSYYYQQTLKASLIEAVQEELVQSISKLMIPSPFADAIPSDAESSSRRSKKSKGKGTDKDVDEDDEEREKIIPLIPFWDFLQNQKKFLLHSNSSSIGGANNGGNPSTSGGGAGAAGANQEISYLIILFLHQCMERSLKDSIQQMISSFQQCLLSLVTKHTTISMIVQQLMIADYHHHRSTSSSSYCPSELEKIFFLCDLMIDYYSKFTGNSGGLSGSHNNGSEIDGKSTSATDSLFHSEMFKEQKRNFFTSPNYLLYILLLLQRKRLCASSPPSSSSSAAPASAGNKSTAAPAPSSTSSSKSNSSAHVIFHELIQEFLYIQYHLLPKDVQEWNKDLHHQKHNHEIILKLMNIALQLQIILSIFIYQSNEIQDLQKYMGNTNAAVSMDNNETDSPLRAVPSVPTTPTRSSEVESDAEVHEKPLKKAKSADEVDVMIPLLEDIFWYSVNEVLFYYRIIVPLLSFIVRNAVMFITIYERPDISYYLLSEGFNVDWYQYYHYLIHLDVEPFLYNPPTMNIPIDDLFPFAGGDGASTNSSTRRRASSSFVSSYNNSLANGNSPLPAAPGSSPGGNSVIPGSETKRKYSFVEQWIETIQPEYDDEGYQFISIITREQCQEILVNKDIGSFILRPQESFVDCQQFILSFRTSGVELIKHAVVRREVNPSYPNPKDPKMRKYLYRCGKLGPVDSLEGILHAISDIISNPLVFIPVMPSFLAYDPHNTNNNPNPNNNSTNGNKDNSSAAAKDTKDKSNQNQSQSFSSTRREDDTTPTSVSSFDFISFDINFHFWKCMQDLMPKLVNTIELNYEFLGHQYDFQAVEEENNATTEDYSNHVKEDEDDIEDDQDEEGDTRSGGTATSDEDGDYVMPGKPMSNVALVKRTRRLLRDLLENYTFSTPGATGGGKNNSAGVLSSLDRVWNLSFSNNDYGRLHERLLSTLTMKHYVHQLFAFSNLLDSLWKYEIEMMDEQQEKLTADLPAPSSTSDEQENPQVSYNFKEISCVDDLEKKILNFQSLKKAITFYSTENKTSNSLLLSYFTSLMNENYVYQSALMQSPPSSSPTARNSPRKTHSEGEKASSALFSPISLHNFPHQMIVSKGLLSPLLSFFIQSERSLVEWIIPDLFSLQQSHLHYSSPSTIRGTDQSHQQLKQLLEKVLSINISFASYDKLSWNQLEDILCKSCPLPSTSSSSSSSSALVPSMGSSSSSLLSYETYLMESILLLLFKSSAVKTIRFTGHRNGYGMNDFLLNDCIEINEFFTLLSKWINQLFEILSILKLNIHGQRIDDHGAVHAAEDDDDDSEAEEEELFPTQPMRSQNLPSRFVKKKSQHEEDEEERKKRMMFSKFDVSDDEEEDDEGDGKRKDGGAEEEEEEVDFSAPVLKIPTSLTSPTKVSSVSEDSETIDLRSPPPKGGDNEAEANADENKEEEEGAATAASPAKKNKKNTLLSSKSFLLNQNDGSDHHPVDVSSLRPLEKILYKISKYWQQILLHPKFTALAHDGGAGSSQHTNNPVSYNGTAASSKYFLTSGSFHFNNVSSPHGPHPPGSSTSSFVNPSSVLSIDFFTIKILLQVIYLLGLDHLPPVPPPPATASTAAANKSTGQQPSAASETINSKEMTQKMINWFFFHKALIQITRTSNELTPFGAPQTFYHYIDVWETKVLSDLTMAKEHIRLGRQSYMGLSPNLFQKSFPNNKTSERRSSIIAGDPDLKHLNDQVLKREFHFPYTMTIASILKLQSFLYENSNNLQFATNLGGPGMLSRKTSTDQSHRRRRGGGGNSTSKSSGGSQFGPLSKSLKVERQQYWEYYYCKLWELVRGEQYLMDTICSTTIQKDLQFLSLYPFGDGLVNANAATTSSASHEKVSSVSPAPSPSAGPTAINTFTSTSTNPSIFPLPISCNSYATHLFNHKKFWHLSSEGHSNYLLTLQEYCYKNRLFQRLLLQYRFIGFLQIDLYGLKEILSLKPIASSSSSSSSSSMTVKGAAPGNSHIGEISASNTINSIHQMTKAVQPPPAAAPAAGGFLSFFSSFGSSSAPAAPVAPKPVAPVAATGGIPVALSQQSSQPALTHLAATNGPVGLGTFSHSSNIASLVPTNAPHTQSMEIYGIVRFVKEFYPKTDQHATAYRSGYYDESFVTTPKRVDILPNGLFPDRSSSSSSSSSSSIASQVQSFHDFEFRQQVLFRFPLPENIFTLLEDHWEMYLLALAENLQNPTETFSFLSKFSRAPHSQGSKGLAPPSAAGDGGSGSREDDRLSRFLSKLTIEEETILFDHFLKTVPPMKIIITIYEKTFFSDLKLGELEMNLFDLNDQNIARDWFPLVNGERQISYLVYLQTKLRFHLMQMDSNEFLYQFSNHHPNQPASSSSSSSLSQSSSAAPAASTALPGAGGKIVGRGQPHPAHLLKASLGTEKGTTSSSNNQQAGSSSPIVIKFNSQSSDNFANLYKDDYVEPDEPKKIPATTQATPVKSSAAPVLTTSQSAVKGAATPSTSNANNKSKFLSHLDDFF